MGTYGRFEFSDGEICYGELCSAESDGSDPYFRKLKQPPWISRETADDTYGYSPAGLKILVPVEPSKIIAVGRNYHAHAAERGADAPTSPLTWLMAPSSLLAHQGVIELPYPEHRVDFEVELGVVIGKTARNVPVDHAREYIFGYTTCLDISDRDIQDREKQFARAKSFDTFTPVGPFVHAEHWPDDMALTLDQNGVRHQNGRTSEMIFSVSEIVSFCSQGTTLLPGDLILTGTPAGVGPIKDGDELVAHIWHMDSLVVTVRNAEKA